MAPVPCDHESLAAPDGATGFQIGFDLHVWPLCFLIAPSGAAGFHVRFDLHVLVPLFWCR